MKQLRAHLPKLTSWESPDEFMNYRLQMPVKELRSYLFIYVFIVIIIICRKSAGMLLFAFSEKQRQP